jgi:hypothetical protein
MPATKKPSAGNKKLGNRVIPAGKTQININVPDDTLAKMKAIADAEGIAYAEAYNFAFSSFISAYESKNGKVKIRPKGKGLEGL